VLHRYVSELWEPRAEKGSRVRCKRSRPLLVSVW
jgi:hypothetical protein